MNKLTPEAIEIRKQEIEESVRLIAWQAWKGAANAHRIYPNNKHTFSEYWGGAKDTFEEYVSALLKAQNLYTQEVVEIISDETGVRLATEEKPKNKFTEWKDSELAKTYEEMKVRWDRLDFLEEKVKEQELIIYDLEEGSAEWESKCNDLEEQPIYFSQWMYENKYSIMGVGVLKEGKVARLSRSDLYQLFKESQFKPLPSPPTQTNK